MARTTKKTLITRLYVYLPDPIIGRQVKSAAAKRGLSVPDYCLRAITAQLVRDGELPPRGDYLNPVGVALDRARMFQKENLRNRVFATSAATMIREARKRRTPR